MRGTPLNPVICKNCGSKFGYPKQQLCRACQPRPAKAQWTEEQKALIRDAFSKDRAYLIERRKKIMELTGFTFHQFQWKARDMGLKMFTSHRRYWTEREIKFLQDHAGEMTIQAMAKTLGRNETGVRVQLYRVGLRGAVSRNGFSGKEFAQLMGVCPTTVYGWINSGKLRTWDDRILDKDAKRFISTETQLYSIRRVDDYMFKALLFGRSA